MKRLQVGTTFSGIGAPEVALKQLGIDHEVAWACDIDKHAKQTYLANHTCREFYRDITQINVAELEPVDLYVFGSPCTDLSTMGKQDLSRGKSALVDYSLDIIDHLLPSYILFENVKGLLSAKFAPFLDRIKTRLGEHYNLDISVFNSLRWGVPQNRERVFCLGTRKDLPQVMLPIQSANTVHLSTILESNPDPKYTLADDRWQTAQKHKANMVARGNSFGYKILKDKAFTLMVSEPANYQLIEQPGQNPRLLTERECARLHGFPDTFVFPVSYNQARRQLGNTITVPILAAILTRLA